MKQANKKLETKNWRTIVMKNKKLTNLKATTKVAFACVAIGWMCWSVGNVCNAQTPPSNLSPDLQEVVKLSQSHMGDEVIVNYIKNSGKSYKLGVDDILYLNSQGVSQGIIGALQTQTASSANPPTAPLPAQPPSSPVTAAPVPPAPASSQPAPVQIIINQNTPSAPQPAPQITQTPPALPTEVPPQGGPEINFNYFHDQLAPFGSWVDVGGSMYWRPDSCLAANPDWRPYYDMGQWVQTDNGLFWQSEYTWGDIPFHYGRWVRNPVYGWLWAPDYTWGPSWVFWRHGEVDGVIGWAPLPVGAVFVGSALMFNGVAVGVDFDFGLGEDYFTFVDHNHFHESFFRMRGHEFHYHMDREHMHGFYGRTMLHNEFHRDAHGYVSNEGIGREKMERLTKVEHAGRFEERSPVGDRKALEVARNHQGGPGNTGGQGHGQPGSKNEPAAPASVNKVFRPPTPTQKTAPAAPQKQAQAPQQKPKNSKPSN